MSKNVRVIVLRTAGTNCDYETEFAFKDSGARVDSLHINKLFSGEIKLEDYHILAIPGGFTYGDDIESGRILANELKARLGDDIKKFIKDKKLIIGICNGFQVLVKAGILPGPSNKEEEKEKEFEQKAALTNNDEGKFEDRWTHLKVNGKSVWTKGLKEIVYFPIAHAEGKFLLKDKEVLEKLKKNGQIAFRYCTEDGTKPDYPQNPNGSVFDIAGITDKTGRILGLMPHPERHYLFVQHPKWTRMKKAAKLGDGAKIFENGVEYVKNNLL